MKLVTLLKEDLDDGGVHGQSVEAVRQSHMQARSQIMGGRENLFADEFAKARRILGPFDDSYLSNVKPLLPRSQVRLLKSVKSRLLLDNPGLNEPMMQTSLSTPKLGTQRYTARVGSPSPLRQLSVPRSGKYVEPERKKAIDKQNMKMLNRLFKIICRDNQYAGLLRVRGEYEVSEDGNQEEGKALKAEDSKIINI